MILLRAAGRTGRIWMTPRGLHGVRPAGIPTGGDFDSPLANDITLPDDAATSLLWWLTAPLIDGTSGGTTETTDAGAYSHVGAVDGAYSQGYAVQAVEADGTVRSGAGTISVTVGAAGAAVNASAAVIGLHAATVAGAVQATPPAVGAAAAVVGLHAATVGAAVEAAAATGNASATAAVLGLHAATVAAAVEAAAAVAPNATAAAAVAGLHAASVSAQLSTAEVVYTRAPGALQLVRRPRRIGGALSEA